MTTGQTAVQAVNLTKIYGKGDVQVTALNSVNCEIEQGRFTAIMGPSGSGKSTLMHLLAGLDSATSGSAYVRQVDITTLNDKELTELRRDHIGFVFQQFNLLPMLTAKQNITLPADLARTPVKAAWFDQLVDVLGIRERLDHRPSQLSGGQQQRVAIARALLTQPHVVFADEPTGNLDTRAGQQVLELLRKFVEELGFTIVMVTHDPAAASFADRVLVLTDGVITGDLTHPAPEEVLAVLAGPVVEAAEITGAVPRVAAPGGQAGAAAQSPVSHPEASPQDSTTTPGAQS
ncbi:MAG: ABC transporter ATP-binding protein [Cellulomonadaceae bacterium]|nr:ABC transporter ATP-binding protein [Cellulomonadaceae bacterium]